MWKTNTVKNYVASRGCSAEHVLWIEFVQWICFVISLFHNQLKGALKHAFVELVILYWKITQNSFRLTIKASPSSDGNKMCLYITPWKINSVRVCSGPTTLFNRFYLCKWILKISVQSGIPSITCSNVRLKLLLSFYCVELPEKYTMSQNP